MSDLTEDNVDELFEMLATLAKRLHRSERSRALALSVRDCAIDTAAAREQVSDRTIASLEAQLRACEGANAAQQTQILDLESSLATACAKHEELRIQLDANLVTHASTIANWRVQCQRLIGERDAARSDAETWRHQLETEIIARAALEERRDAAYSLGRADGIAFAREAIAEFAHDCEDTGNDATADDIRALKIEVK